MQAPLCSSRCSPQARDVNTPVFTLIFNVSDGLIKMEVA